MKKLIPLCILTFVGLLRYAQPANDLCLEAITPPFRAAGTCVQATYSNLDATQGYFEGGNL
jgi:hypothetical protein